MTQNPSMAEWRKQYIGTGISVDENYFPYTKASMGANRKIFYYRRAIA
jgi:hypothetical protein